jgi:hypothetical protein
LVLAISSSWARVTLPTLFGVRLTAALWMPAALRSRIAAGGVLVMKVKLRSL